MLHHRIRSIDIGLTGRHAHTHAHTQKNEQRTALLRLHIQTISSASIFCRQSKHKKMSGRESNQIHYQDCFEAEKCQQESTSKTATNAQRWEGLVYCVFKVTHMQHLCPKLCQRGWKEISLIFGAFHEKKHIRKSKYGT